MDKREIIEELKKIRERVDVLIKHISGESSSSSALQNLEREVGKQKISEKKITFSSESMKTPEGGSAGLTGSMDLSDPIRDVYLKLIKRGEMTMDEIKNDSSLNEEEKESLPIMVKTLVRQGYLEKYMESGVMKYAAKTGKKAKKKISDDIWGALE